MGNPRIVYGHREAVMAFSVRGRAGGEAFQMMVTKETAAGYPRSALEDRLMEEARSLLRMAARREDPVDWEALGFARTGEFGVWSKALSREELDRLLAP